MIPKDQIVVPAGCKLIVIAGRQFLQRERDDAILNLDGTRYNVGVYIGGKKVN